MESALKLQDFFFFSKRAGCPHRLKCGVGTAGGEPDLFGTCYGVDQRLGQQNRLLVGGEEGAALLHCLDHRFHHRRMGMPQQHRTRSHQPVNVLVAADVENMGPLSSLNQEVEVVSHRQVAGIATRQIFCRLIQQFTFQGRAFRQKRPPQLQCGGCTPLNPARRWGLAIRQLPPWISSSRPPVLGR